MYDYNEFEDETQAPDFWTKDHYEDEPNNLVRNPTTNEVGKAETLIP